MLSIKESISQSTRSSKRSIKTRCNNLPFTSIERVQSRISYREQIRNLAEGIDIKMQRNRGSQFDFSLIPFKAAKTIADYNIKSANVSKMKSKDILKDA